MTEREVLRGEGYEPAEQERGPTPLTPAAQDAQRRQEAKARRAEREAADGEARPVAGADEGAAGRDREARGSGDAVEEPNGAEGNAGATDGGGDAQRTPEVAPEVVQAGAPGMRVFSPAELEESGLLWLANRALHPFGVAIAVTQIIDEETGEKSYDDALMAWSVDDPGGLMFSAESEETCRHKFFAWLASRDVTSERLYIEPRNGEPDA